MRFMLAISLVIAASVPNYAQSVAVSPALKMPGRLVETDAGHRLHVWCTGVGTPTVILVGGLGSYSIEWALVQPGVAENSRVCSYDRAGYAWSEKGPEPRGFGVSVAELHQVLQRANVRPPYVLVGHSWGGRIIRQRIPLGDKPLFVISAGRLSWDAQARASGRSYVTAQRARIANEACTAGLSRNSQFAVAYASFHSVHLYDPLIVTNAILRVLKSVRGGSRLEPFEQPSRTCEFR